MTAHWETVWTFDTPNFRVALEVTPEDMDPADSFQFPEDIEAVRSGAVEWFCARVVVYQGEDEDNLTEIASDVLGGCAYKSVREFYTSHRVHRSADYFTDMISVAVLAARHKLRTTQALRVRANAT